MCFPGRHDQIAAIFPHLIRGGRRRSMVDRDSGRIAGPDGDAADSPPLRPLRTMESGARDYFAPWSSTARRVIARDISSDATTHRQVARPALRVSLQVVRDRVKPVPTRQDSRASASLERRERPIQLMRWPWHIHLKLTWSAIVNPKLLSGLGLQTPWIGVLDRVSSFVGLFGCAEKLAVVCSITPVFIYFYS